MDKVRITPQAVTTCWRYLEAVKAKTGLSITQIVSQMVMRETARDTYSIGGEWAPGMKKFPLLEIAPQQQTQPPLPPQPLPPPQPPAPKREASGPRPPPKDVREVLEAAHGMMLGMMEDEARGFFDFNAARGWADGGGRPLHDWTYMLRKWHDRQQEMDARKGYDEKRIPPRYESDEDCPY